MSSSISWEGTLRTQTGSPSTRNRHTQKHSLRLKSRVRTGDQVEGLFSMLSHRTPHTVSKYPVISTGASASTNDPDSNSGGARLAV